MASFKDHVSHKIVKLLFAADSGMGKTSALASLANAGYRLAIIDMDNGVDVLKGLLKPEAYDRVFYKTLSPHEPASWDVAESLTRTWKTDTEDLGPISKFTDNDVLVIDSLSFLGSAAMAKAKSLASIDPKAVGFNQAVWGVAQNLLEFLVARLTSIHTPCNIIMTTHLQVVEDEATGSKKVYPASVGKALPAKMNRYFNNVWRIDAKPNGDRVIRTVADYSMALKCSSKAIGKEATLDLAAHFKTMISA